MPSMNIVLACFAALSWGVADFLGGYATRDSDERHSEAVLVSSQIVSLGLVVTLLVAPSLRQLEPHDIAVGALSGLGLSLGVRFLYAALATGRMAVVAPVSAATCVAVSTVGGTIRGGLPHSLQFVGLTLVATAVVLTSLSKDEGGARRGPLLLALLAGAGFGSQLFALSFVRSSGVVAQVSGELTALLLFSFVAMRRGVFGLVRSNRVVTVICGSLRALGTGLFVAAVSVQSSAATSMAANLYSVFTALTAAVVLRERISKLQLTAVSLSVLGIFFLAR